MLTKMHKSKRRSRSSTVTNGLYAYSWGKLDIAYGIKSLLAFCTGIGRWGSKKRSRQSTPVGILQYSRRNTPVLLWKYSSTAPRVLEYFPESTAVLPRKYSDLRPRVLRRLRFSDLIFCDVKGESMKTQLAKVHVRA